MNPEKVSKLVSELLFSRNQAHVFHWQTQSFAQHKALEDYYSSIIDLVDSLVETYQGTQSIIKIFSNDEKYVYDGSALAYFETLLTNVQNNRVAFEEETDLQNIVDEIISEIKSVLYKLKNLK